MEICVVCDFHFFLSRPPQTPPLSLSLGHTPLPCLLKILVSSRRFYEFSQSCYLRKNGLNVIEGSWIHQMPSHLLPKQRTAFFCSHLFGSKPFLGGIVGDYDIMKNAFCRAKHKDVYVVQQFSVYNVHGGDAPNWRRTQWILNIRKQKYREKNSIQEEEKASQSTTNNNYCAIHLYTCSKHFRMRDAATRRLNANGNW